MQCSGCGADIPSVGKVCPFCGRDKSDDKAHEWIKFVGGIIGLIIGFSTFDSFLAAIVCFFPGYIAGAIFGIFVPGKKHPSQPRVVFPPTESKAKSPVTEKLVQLKQLHDKGLLTEEEYTRKKAEILAKL